jgi:hypothetical protein
MPSPTPPAPPTTPSRRQWRHGAKTEEPANFPLVRPQLAQHVLKNLLARAGALLRTPPLFLLLVILNTVE